MGEVREEIRGQIRKGFVSCGMEFGSDGSGMLQKEFKLCI